jgi:hypothetical protein
VSDGIAAQRRAHCALFDRNKGRRQRSGIQQRRQIGGALLGESTGDADLPSAYLFLNGSGFADPIVQDDRGFRSARCAPR